MKLPGCLPVGSVLLVLCSGLTWYFQPTGGALPWMMQSLPLLLTLPGQLRNDRRARQWLGFILLFILLVSITQTFNPLLILRMLALINLLLAIAMFGWLLYSMKSAQSAPPSHKES
jgi:uncharacterized membrane protein